MWRTHCSTNNPYEEPFTVKKNTKKRVKNPLRYKQPVWRTFYGKNNTCEEPFTIQTTRVKNPLRYKQPVWRTLYGKNNPCVEPFYGKNNPCEEPFALKTTRVKNLFTVKTTRVKNPLRYKQPVCRTLYDTNNLCEEHFTIQKTRVKNPLRNKQPVKNPLLYKQPVWRTLCRITAHAPSRLRYRQSLCTGEPRVRRVQGNHVYGVYGGTTCTACTGELGVRHVRRVQGNHVENALRYRLSACTALYHTDRMCAKPSTMETACEKKKTMAVQTACGKTPDDTISLWQNHLRHRQPVAKHYDIDSL